MYNATLNDRYTLSASSIESMKRKASLIANRSFRPTDRMRITSRPAGDLVIQIFTRTSRRNGSVIEHGAWVEAV